MQVGQRGLAARNRRVSSNSASVSVGKPAIRSAPMAMPGRRARARSTTAMASARRCRRRMRFRIRSLPACSDRCRCGISRGSSAISRHRSSSIAAGIDRRQPQPRQFRAPPAAGAGSSGRATGRRAGRDRRRRCRRRSARSPGSRRRPGCAPGRRSTPIGTERLGPRPNGMMQNVQRWSQPCCTCTKARARLANSVTRWAAVSRAAMMSDTAEPAPGCQLSGFSLSSLPRTRWTLGRAAQAAGSICAAQPVTTMRASGRSRATRRMAWRAWRSASAVTAQVLTITVSVGSPRPTARA